MRDLLVSGHDPTQAIPDRHWRFRDGEEVSVVCDFSWFPCRNPCTPGPGLTRDTSVPRARGSKFLKDWMEFLEENANLRYPDLASLTQEA
jgi:hypothetical protein